MAVIGLPSLLRKKSRHPAVAQGCGEGEPDRRARALGFEHPALHQRRDNAARLSLAGSNDGAGFAAWQFTTIEDGLQNIAGLWRQKAETDFFFRPKQNACTKPVGLHQALHESDLINADHEKEAGEFSQRLFTGVFSSVEIVAPWKIAVGQEHLVLLDVACEAACDGPDCVSIELVQEHGMRHESRHATIAVQKRMHPEQPVVGGGGGDDGFGLAKSSVRILKTLQEAGEGTGTDRDQPAHLHISCAQLPGHDRDSFPGDWVLYP